MITQRKLTSLGGRDGHFFDKSDPHAHPQIGTSTFRGMMSSQHRPVYREKTDALEFQLREVEVALEYFEHTRNRPFIGRPHRTMDYDGSKTAR